MNKFPRKPHPARNARIAATGLAISGLISMISVFNVNTQVANLAKTTADLKAVRLQALQAKAALLSQAETKIVYVTVPANAKPRQVAQVVSKPVAVVPSQQQSHAVSGGSKRP